MIDWVTIWLGTQAAGFVFKPILEDLAKDAAKDWAKDYCKDAFKSVFQGQNEWKEAAGNALAEFLLQFEEELLAAGETDVSIENYVKSLNSFSKLPTVREALGSVILDCNSQIDAKLLSDTWMQHIIEQLPDDFDWFKLCRRYQNKARIILRNNPKLREILNSQQLEAIAEFTQRLGGVSPGFEISKYAADIKKRYGYLKLESLDPNPDHQRIALTKIFVEQKVRSCQQFNPRVYELPVEHRDIMRMRGSLDINLDEQELARQREAYLQQTSSFVLEVINNQRLCVILGDPGSGKSVLLEYVALTWAERPSIEQISHPFPLLIELKTYAENLSKGICRNFLEYLDHGSGSIGHLEQKEVISLLNRGHAMMLFDGLDEIFDKSTRQQVALDLVSFTTRYPAARFIVTSRIIGYDLVAPYMRNGGFQHYLLQELDKDQQEAFIEHWHKLAYENLTERAEKSNRLFSSIKNFAAIQELAQNPLLLTLMALLNRHRELPRDRNELYERASELMLFQWDTSRALLDDPLLSQQSFDYKDKQAMLRAVALHMQTSPEGLAGNIIAADELTQTLIDYLKEQGCENPRPIAVRLIQQLRERNYILCLLGDDYFAFVHRTFLEFFCSWAWVWKFEKGETDSKTGKFKRITIEELQKQTFDTHRSDERWHEVLRLIASRLEPQSAGILIQSLLTKENTSNWEQNVILAAKCYSDLRGMSVVDELRLKLETFLKLVGIEINSISINEVLFDFNRTMQRVEVSRKAIELVAQCWPKAPETRKWLLSIIDDKRSSTVSLRTLALRELINLSKDDPDTLPWLKTRAQQDELPEVRQAAVEALAGGWKDNPDILDILKTRAQQDEFPEVRQAAVEALALTGVWKDDPDTLPWLKTRAQQDEFPEVRQTAVEALARGWKDDPDTLS
ncbi:MAG: NACHT domain-containing protein [Halobacteriota archaeon]